MDSPTPTPTPDNEPYTSPQPESQNQHNDSAIDGEQDATRTAALLAKFVRAENDPVQKEQERFIGEVVLSALESGPFIAAKTLVSELAQTLVRGLPSAQQAHAWYERATAVVSRTSAILRAIQRTTGEKLDTVSACAMGGIAHHCPKYLHMVIAPNSKSLAAALDAGNLHVAEENRQIILDAIGGGGSMDSAARFDWLLNEYSLTQEKLLQKFIEANHTIFQPESFTLIAGQVERRFQDMIREELKVEQHEFRMTFTTNLPDDQQVQNTIPHGGLIVEALSELVFNALKVMKETNTGSNILVTVILRKDRSVHLMVRDDGPGTDKEDTEELFQPEFTTTAEHGGTGMGLYYLRENLANFGATICAMKNEEDDEPGMTFTCTIPPPQEQ